MKKGLLSTTLFVLFLALITGLISCQPEPTLSPWKTDVLSPLIKTKIGIADLIPSENLNTDDSSRLNLIYRTPLFSTSGKDFFTIPNSTERVSVSLKTITLSDNAITTSIPLSEAYPPSRLLNGQNITLPALTLDNAGKANINAETFFTSAQLVSGSMIVQITNGFPVALDTLQFLLSNRSDGSKVARLPFYDIPAGASVTDTVSMAGVYAEGLMDGVLEKVVSAPSDGKVLINSRDALELNVEVKDLKAKEAIAIFPAQDLINFDQNWRYDFGGPRIKELKIRSGKLRLQVVSTIEETIYITYTAPGMSKNGSQVVRNFVVPPASRNEPYQETQVLDLADAEINLRGKASEGFQEENALHHQMVASIRTSTEPKYISQEDSVYVFVGVENLEPEYALGYFGQWNENIGPETVGIDAFNNLNGQMGFSKATLKMQVENYTGTNGELTIGNITALSQNDEELTLQSSSLSNAIAINPAQNRLKPFVWSLPLTEQNSNVAGILSAFPKAFTYSAGLSINPEGDDGQYNEYLYYDSEISASLDLNVPLAIESDGFVLSDTIALNLASIVGDEPFSQVQLNGIAYNDFPFAGQLSFVLLTANNTVVDTLFNTAPVLAEAAQLIPKSGKVAKPSKTVTTQAISEERFRELMGKVEKAVIIANFRTVGNGPKSIYDYYRLEYILSAQFQYTIQP